MNRSPRFLKLLVASLLIPALASCQTQNKETPAVQQTDPHTGSLLVYVGTYTGPKSKGIYLMRLDLATGNLTAPELAGEADQPSFLAIHPNHHFLYAVGEIDAFDGKKSGAVDAFAIAPDTGKLTLLNQQPSGGESPCHLTVDAAGKNVLVANYGGGSVSAIPIQSDGRLAAPSAFIQHVGSSVNRDRQQAPHGHSINLDAANHFAFAADLGLDKILVYRFDSANGSLAPNDPPSTSITPGSGPRHFDFHPNGHFAYVINEIASTVTAFRYDASRGTLTTMQTVTTLPQDFKGQNGTADIHVHPSGRFLYGSNRGHDSIAAFSINAETGMLTPLGQTLTQGKTPRNFGIDPTGTYLLAANQDSDTIVVFSIDPKTGQLHSSGTVANVPRPVCVQFMPPAH
jgi:6-phosphogluconolactonase